MLVAAIRMDGCGAPYCFSASLSGGLSGSELLLETSALRIVALMLSVKTLCGCSPGTIVLRPPLARPLTALATCRFKAAAAADALAAADDAVSRLLKTMLAAPPGLPPLADAGTNCDEISAKNCRVAGRAPRR